ncbi:MAG: hypothetical protein IJJ60_02505, partial [Clostridia bacterium]|nr:hypothetical protein [Clostridia bacterium]
RQGGQGQHRQHQGQAKPSGYFFHLYCSFRFQRSVHSQGNGSTNPSFVYYTSFDQYFNLFYKKLLCCCYYSASGFVVTRGRGFHPPANPQPQMSQLPFMGRLLPFG